MFFIEAGKPHTPPDADQPSVGHAQHPAIRAIDQLDDADTGQFLGID